MSSSHDFKPLNALLSQWMEQRKQNPREDDFLPQNLATAWMHMVGPLLARCCRPLKLTGHVLYIEVSSEAWGQALMEHQPFLLQQLKTRLPKLSIGNLQFSVKNSS